MPGTHLEGKLTKSVLFFLVSVGGHKMCLTSTQSIVRLGDGGPKWQQLKVDWRHSKMVLGWPNFTLTLYQIVKLPPIVYLFSQPHFLYQITLIFSSPSLPQLSHCCPSPPRLLTVPLHPSLTSICLSPTQDFFLCDKQNFLFFSLVRRPGNLGYA